MQTPPQATWPPGQPQFPPEQIAPVPTEVEQSAPTVAPLQTPEAPQCVASVCGSTHVPPQFTCDPGHVTWQRPAVHTLPVSEQSSPSSAPVQVSEAPQ
jgi:hypothetical protein